MSIRTQVAGIIGGLLILVMGATAGGLYWAEREALLQKFEEARENQLTQFAQSLKDALMVHDDLAAMNLANALLKTPGVLDAYGVNPRGMILAHGHPARVGKKENPTLGYRKAQPLSLGKAKAEAVILYSPTYLKQAVEEALRPVAHRIATVSGIALAMGFFAALLLAGKLIRPIKRIGEGTRRISSGDLSHRLSLGAGTN
jgi:methyl-accepting chemotaxis protein